MKTILTILWGIAAMLTNAQPKSYQLFDNKGKPVEYNKMIEELSQADVVFFGEMHNDPMCHWMEVQVLKSLHKTWKVNLNVGMEMFENDNQQIIDEYFSGIIGYKQFEDECRLWPNYATDYASIVDLCKEYGLRLVGTNIPRRYANVVKNKGLNYLDSLSSQAKQYIAPLPIPYQTNQQANQALGIMAAMGNHKGANV